MKSRYELTMSVNYVPDWTFVEAIRELFQNALDNEIESPDNKMGFDYNPNTEVLTISNKTSLLEIESLLIGHSTKTNNENTIGKHGEGYKVAFMILLREGKTIRVYNYGKREIWDAKIVKSRRYNGSLIPVVTVEKGAVWKQVPNNDLIMEIKGITPKEYGDIVEKNLNLQDKVMCCDVKDFGKILTDRTQRGKVYVCGLYICTDPSLSYGYSFRPNIIALDRDRKLVNTFNIAWETSLMWKKAFQNNELREEVIQMMENNATDVQYMTSRTMYSDMQVEKDISNKIAENFVEKYGENSVPVDTNDGLSRVRDTDNTPVMVNSLVKHYIDKSDAVEIPEVPEEEKLKDEFQKLLDDIQHKLDQEEVERFLDLIEKIRD